MKIIEGNELTESLFSETVINEFFNNVNIEYFSKGDEKSSNGRIISSSYTDVLPLIKFIMKSIDNERFYVIIVRKKNAVKKWKGFQLSELVDDIDDIIKTYSDLFKDLN